MLRFDKPKLLQSLNKLPVRARAAFAAACAERLLPAFGGTAANQERNLLSDSLAHLWTHIVDDASGSGSLHEALTLSQSLLPDEGEALNQGRPYAGDAVAAVIYAIQARLSGDIQDAAWAAQRAYDAVDHAVMSRINTSLIDNREEAAVIADPTIQSELERQKADLADLQVAMNNPTDFGTAIARLQSRAKEDAEALFSGSMKR